MATKKTKPRLPVVLANVVVRYDAELDEYLSELREVEVLTIHFNRRTMRVRYTWDDYFGQGPKVKVSDIDAGPFFARYGFES